jgi:hypothetical protein
LAGKHAPIELGKYVAIHETAMRALVRDGHVVREDLRLAPGVTRAAPSTETPIRSQW